MNGILINERDNIVYKNEKIPPAVYDRHPRTTSKLQPNLFETLHIQQPSNKKYIDK